MKRLASALIIASAYLAAACSNSPSTSIGNSPVAPVSSVTIRIIGPTAKTTPEPAIVVLADIPGIDFVRRFRNEIRGQAVRDALAKEGFTATVEYRDALAAELRKAGAADVTTLTVAREPSSSRFEPKESELPAGPATACFVDTFLVYGFVAPVLGADYEPYMVANLKIFRGGDHKMTYREKFFYNYLRRNVEVAPSRPLASWNDAAAVEADIRGARDALRNAIEDVVRTVASHLKANGRLDKC
jgi:hypothetical protein